MEKTIQEKWVLYTKHTLNSPMDIGVHASKDEPELRNIAERLELKVNGPLEHAYWDMAIQGVPHVLEIWLPVQGLQGSKPIDGLKLVGTYKCLVADFKMPIEEIGDAWMALGEKAKKLGHQLTNHDREIYKMMDCDNSENNDIEIQIGIE